MRLTVLHKLPSGCFLYLPVLFYGIIQNMMLKKVKDNYEKKVAAFLLAFRVMPGDVY